MDEINNETTRDSVLGTENKDPGVLGGAEGVKHALSDANGQRESCQPEPKAARSKDSYNAYMREYMRKYRERKRAVKE